MCRTFALRWLLFGQCHCLSHHHQGCSPSPPCPLAVTHQHATAGQATDQTNMLQSPNQRPNHLSTTNHQPPRATTDHAGQVREACVAANDQHRPVDHEAGTAVVPADAGTRRHAHMQPAAFSRARTLDAGATGGAVAASVAAEIKEQTDRVRAGRLQAGLHVAHQRQRQQGVCVCVCVCGRANFLEMYGESLTH